MTVKLERDKVRCMSCGWQGDSAEVDMVIDPRPKTNQLAEKWSVCPECRTPESIQKVCDEPGCDREATCGWVHGRGEPEEIYRWTCGSHAYWAKDRAA